MDFVNESNSLIEKFDTNINDYIDKRTETRKISPSGSLFLIHHLCRETILPRAQTSEPICLGLAPSLISLVAAAKLFNL